MPRKPCCERSAARALLEVRATVDRLYADRIALCPASQRAGFEIACREMLMSLQSIAEKVL